MSDVQRHLRESHKPRFFPVASAVVIEIGDLLWWDDDNSTVKPMSDATYGASLAATQKTYAPLFVGMAADRSPSGKTDPIQVDTGGVKKFVCASATFDPGDLVGVDDNVAGDTLEDQQVIAVANPSLAIGRVATRVSTAATEVEIELFPVLTGRPTEVENQRKVFRHVVTTDEDTAGEVDLDTGWGANPEGPVLVQLWDTDLKKIKDLDADVDMTAGVITVKDGTGVALTATNVLMVVAYRYADTES